MTQSYPVLFFFFNDPATTEIYTLSLHDALPISVHGDGIDRNPQRPAHAHKRSEGRSEEHTSELQSPDHLVCRLLLEKKKQYQQTAHRLRSTGALEVADILAAAQTERESYLALAYFLFFFFFNDTATTEIYTLSLHDALPIYGGNRTMSIISEVAKELL